MVDADLEVVPPWAFGPNPARRSVDIAELEPRDGPYDGMPIDLTAQPWFCWFNESVLEFFIYVDEDISSGTSVVSSSPHPATTAPASLGNPSTAPAVQTTAGTNAVAYPTSPSTPLGPHSSWVPEPQKREYTKRSRDYPRLIKIVEKRKTSGNIQPYCEKVFFHPDWTFQAVPGVEPICINENESPGGGSSGPANIQLRTYKRDSLGEIESNCACEWFSA